MEAVWTVIYIGLALASAVAAILSWLWRRWRTRGHPHWPMSEGTVESYRYEAGRYHTIWFVIYSYSANGEYYSGEFIPQLPWMTEYFRSPDKVEDTVKAWYPVGTKFPMRFRPDDPERSVPFSREAMVSPLSTPS